MRCSLGFAGFLTALVLAASASPAEAAVTIGQIGSDSPACSSVELLQGQVSSGAAYTVTEARTITSWSHLARPGTGELAVMQVFRSIEPPPNVYQVVAHDGPRSIQGGMLNSFQTNVPVQPGDKLGMFSVAGVGCAFRATPADTVLSFTALYLADGEGAQFTPLANARVNISAVLAPFNTFTLAPITHNKKKGSATLNLTLPNPGTLTAAGKGVKAAAAGARASKSVGAGPATLVIRAKGKKRKKLSAAGRVKLKVKVTYTPTGGDPASRSVNVKLKKHR